jgi:hypothetical protein
MLALEPNRKLRRRQLRFRGIGPDAVGLPFGSRPEAWIYYGTLHWADTDLMQAEIVSAANHDLPLPEFDLSARGEGKWPVVSGEWLVLHARYAAQSNRVKPVKPVKPGQTQSNPVKPSQTQSNQSRPVKPVKLVLMEVVLRLALTLPSPSGEGVCWGRAGCGGRGCWDDDFVVPG